MRIWANVAEIGKTKTLDGGLAVHGAAGLPFLLHEGMEVAFVPPRMGAPRKARVVSARHLKDTSFLVHFDAVPDIDTAETLVGCYCLARRSDIPADFDEGRVNRLIGAQVIDTRFGELGRVADYIDRTSQALYKVEGKYGEVLIPDVAELIEGVDADAGLITTRIPCGLLELTNDKGPKTGGLP